MPLFMQPEAGDIVATKKVRPVSADGTPLFEESGPFEEYFEIDSYLDPKVDRACVEDATTTITHKNNRVEQKYDHTQRVYALIARQLKGWRTIAPDGADPKRTETLAPPDDASPEDAAAYARLRWWKFTPLNVSRLPWDAASFLFDEIQNCGGLIATRAVKVTTDLGQVLDFRGAPALLRPVDKPQGHDSKRAAVLQPAGAGARNEVPRRASGAQTAL